MMSLTQKIKVGAAILILLLAIGCGGGGGNPVAPPGDGNPPDNPPNNPPADKPPEGRQLWGMWSINFDEATLAASAAPVPNVGGYFQGVDPAVISASAGCLGVKVNSFDPATRVLDVNVNVKNPHKNPGYDVRAVVYTDAAGHEVRNPEGWTETFDIPGGRDLNPFKEFAKDKADHQFAPSTEQSESYKVYVPEAADSGKINVAIDGSWYQGTADAVYALENFHHTEMYDEGSSYSEIYIDVRDPKGIIDHVTLEAAQITGEHLTDMERYVGDTWRAVVKNYNDVPVGHYDVKVTASQLGSDAMVICDYAAIDICKEYGWARTWGGISGANPDSPVLGDRARDVATDYLGNVYVTGMFTSSVDFDPGPETEMYTSNGEFDIFLCKFDSGGNFQWARTWGGPYSEFGDSIAVDGNGNAWVTGRYVGAVDFNPAAEMGIHYADGKDAFLVRYSPKGEFQGAFTWGGPGDDYGYGIAIDNNGYVYVVGNFESVCDFDPGTGVDYHSAASGDIFVSKFDNNGFFQWARTWGGSNWDFAEGVSVDDFGRVYVTGNIYGSVDLDPGPWVDMQSPGQYWDVFLVALEADGDYRWGTSWGGEGWDFGYAVVTDGFSNVYVTGDFQYTVDFDPGSGTLEIETGYEHYGYLSKFDMYGNFLWVRALGGVEVVPVPDDPPPGYWDDWDWWDNWWGDSG